MHGAVLTVTQGFDDDENYMYFVKLPVLFASPVDTLFS